jgi:hypothetical protein
MANPAHVAKLREGAEAWNSWRERRGEIPDLSGLKLVDKKLDNYNLTSTNLSTSKLRNVSFLSSGCDDVSFERADLRNVAFQYVTMRRCNFKQATIAFSRFSHCILENGEFTRAFLVSTSFAHVSLQAARGFDTLEGSQGNSISIDTFFRSGGLPESLLRSADVPEEFIGYAASLVGTAIEYYSCFLSYSSKDDEFARRLYNDLQGKNIRTWFAPEDLKIGDRFRARIDESIRVHDKLVLILSANSIASDWVETEVESALERERKEGRDVLFPIAIDDEGFDSQQPWAADIRRKRQIGDFRNWKSHDDYTRAFEKLVRDLKKSQPPIIMRG